MMAAYAALLSLLHTIHQIEHHPLPPISIHNQQLVSLTETVSFLQEFLETYHSPVADGDEPDPLEMRIADAAYAAEDVIESHIVDLIELRKSIIEPDFEEETYYLPQTNSQGQETDSEEDLHSDDQETDSDEEATIPAGFIPTPERNYMNEDSLEKVIKDRDLIKREVMEMEMVTVKEVESRLLQRNVTASVGSSRSSIMVGFDDVLLELMDKLTAGRLDRQLIPIVGMGGIGKTTLATHVYAHPCIKEHFDICAWTTISQKYDTREILCDLLHQVNKKGKEELSNMSEDELGLALYQYLSMRRFLIVMDDMWSIEAWEKIHYFFPDNNNSSRIMVTTRLSKLASQLDNYYGLNMKFLDEVTSWNLFLKIVFGDKSPPPELEDIGKKILETCKGLPLSIVVTGGLLKKLETTQECWESIRKNSSSIANSENEDFCLKILKMSYNHLPVYLKSCFLYMGVFEEDRAVRVSTLIKLWVSEGFVRPVSGKSMETTAKEYLEELVERNLILVHELGSTGNIKFCKIHDLLRDLCWREAQKERFYNVIGRHKFEGLTRPRCVVIPRSAPKDEVCDALRSMQSARSLVCHSKEVVPLAESRLLRTLKAYDRDTESLGSPSYLLDDGFRFVNSRYLAVGVGKWNVLFSSLGLLWNLHTLIVFHSIRLVAPYEIWKMPQLKHLEFHKGDLELPYPRNRNIVIMENLETLKGVRNLRSAKIVPNIKKLGVTDGEIPHLKSLSKLESCRCWGAYGCWGVYGMGVSSFPHSLKKLSLGSNSNHWELNDWVVDKIGALPLLEKFQLERAQFFDKQWETSEEQFSSLKFLELKWCVLKCWMTESSHFPRLEQLHVYGLKELEEIPCEIGEIATLQSLHLAYCRESVVESAKAIAEEQEELQVRVVVFNTNNNQLLRTLTAPNFLLEYVDF